MPRANESDIVRFLVADPSNPGSVVSQRGQRRENLRTTREILPREAWQTVNDLYLYTQRDGESGVDRRTRNRFLTRVISEHQRLDGVLSPGDERDEAYEMWRLGQAIERADMTTRVLGVRAAALLAAPDDADDYDEVQWMGVLRSLTRAADVPALPPRARSTAQASWRSCCSISSSLARSPAACERVPFRAAAAAARGPHVAGRRRARSCSAASRRLPSVRRRRRDARRGDGRSAAGARPR